LGLTTSLDSKLTNNIGYFVSAALKVPRNKKPYKKFSTLEANSHFITLFALAVSVRPKLILELGVAEGGTSLPLLEGAHLVGAHLDSVDMAHTPFKCPKRLRKNWTFHHLDVIDFLHSLPPDRIYDLVFIDDLHNALHVKKEIEILDKHVNTNTIILLHDTIHRSKHHKPKYAPEYDMRTIRPYLALKELSPEKWEYASIPVFYGLTLLRKIVND